MLKVAVLVSGGGTNLQAIIDAIEKKKITNTKIEVVISNKKEAYALERARKHKIAAEYISPKEFDCKEQFNQAMLSTLEKYKVDLIVLAGYLVILPACVVETYENRMINIHPSLIPSFCGPGFYGLKVHEAVLERGNKVTGATVHFVDSGCDTGPIILQKAVEVKQEDTAETLQRRVMEEAEWTILPQAIHMIANHQIEIRDNKVYQKKEEFV